MASCEETVKRAPRLSSTFFPFFFFSFFFFFFFFVPFVSFVFSQAPVTRIVSLVPALTSMLLAIDARPQLVAVSSYDDDPQVRDLPRVGALLDPDVERILSLKPDLVL